MTDHGLTTLRRSDPGTIGPRRIVTHMLKVAAGEFCDPVAGIVLMKAGDFLLQEFNG